MRAKSMWCLCAWLASIAPAAALAEVYGTKTGKVYHTMGAQCASAARISDSNKVRFASEDEARRSGRRICKRCEDLAAREAATPPQPQETEKGGKKADDRGGTNGHGEPEGPSERRPIRESSVDIPPEHARVVKVLTGGTLVLDSGEKAVLAGIVCPVRGQPFAKDAARFIAEQTRDRTVRITVDSSPFLRRDALGRAVVYIAPDDGGRDLAGELLFQGYAWMERCSAFDRRGDYLRQEESAFHGERGIWAPLEGADGKAMVATGRHAYQYHSTKCKHLEHMCDVMTLSLNEAKARRLVPCEDYRGK